SPQPVAARTQEPLGESAVGEQQVEAEEYGGVTGAAASDEQAERLTRGRALDVGGEQRVDQLGPVGDRMHGLAQAAHLVFAAGAARARMIAAGLGMGRDEQTLHRPAQRVGGYRTAPSQVFVG